MATKTIKLCDYVSVKVDGEETKLSNKPSDLWDFLGWDIKNDKNADECAKIVTQQLFCFGFCDLSPLADGHEVIVSFRFNE